MRSVQNERGTGPRSLFYSCYRDVTTGRGCTITFMDLRPRILGLDVGDRRIGIAVSGELGITAQPVLTLERTNRRQDLKSIQRLIRKYACAKIVVGNPLYMSGDQSPQAAKAQAFAEMLRVETGLPVDLWDERLTTTEAHRHLHAAGRTGRSGHKAVVDQVAAVLILESYLAAKMRASGEAGS